MLESGATLTAGGRVRSGQAWAAAEEIQTCLGLVSCPRFWRTSWFQLALLAGPLVWFSPWWTWSVEPSSLVRVISWPFLGLVLWTPCVEELLFRGVLQGQLIRQGWGPLTCRGVSLANVATTVAFVVAHGGMHPLLWAVAVAGPSLVLGYMRDRSGSVYPAMVLHGLYNAGYFALTGLPQVS